MQQIFPVLLSGGAGSRLWPLSRARSPKHLIPLLGPTTLFQKAAERAVSFAPPTVIAANEQRFQIAEQLRSIGIDGATIVLEPVARNTAAAAAIAALTVAEKSPDGLVLLMPADHLIPDVEAFSSAVRTAAAWGERGSIVLFGIRPDRPATGYGYIALGEPLAPGAPVHSVAAFVEKPDRATAEAYLADGNHLWNSGIVLAPATLLLEEFRTYEPDLLTAAEAALAQAERDADFLRLDGNAYARCRSVSIDYAIMERSRRVAIVPVSFAWNDVGSWSTLWSIAAKDDAGNALLGPVLSEATRDSYVRSEGPVVATLGVENLVIVATGDAVLIAAKGHDQEVRRIVERLQKEKPDCV